MNIESERLSFVERRDGVNGALLFAKQSLFVYRAALKKKDGRRSNYGQAYRRGLVLSCMDFRDYIRMHKP